MALTVTTTDTWDAPERDLLIVDERGDTQLIVTEHEARMLVKELEQALATLAPHDRPRAQIWLPKARFTALGTRLGVGDDLGDRILALSKRVKAYGSIYVTRDEAQTVLEALLGLINEQQYRATQAQGNLGKTYAGGTKSASERLESARYELGDLQRMQRKLNLFIEEERDTDERVLAGLERRKQGG